MVIYINTTYSGSYGRLKIHFNDYLSDSFVKSLLELDIKDIRLKLYETSYREDIDKATTISTDDVNILITAINRHVINNARTALFAIPPQIKSFMKTYVSKWDIESIKAIITSKVINHEIKSTDSFIMSFRDIPLGIYAGNLKREDFRILMEKNDVDSIINYLLNYGFNYLLKELEEYKKTGDISSLLSAMDYHYYSDLINNALFYNGDEGQIINYVKTTVDLNNILTLAKALELKVPFEKIENKIIGNGNLSKSSLSDIFRSGNVIDLLSVFKHFNIDEALDYYNENKNLSLFEISMRKALFQKYIDVMLRDTASLYIFAYVLYAERERDNLRSIIVGKSYKLDNNIIERMLI
ncbi:V-type ATPase subunit [Ferroplasma sp.]|uniref:V-type ATPase subunit n=1 Tax=Ferroplasma sp. TaxID=2591003 RepID=UPI00307CF119